MSQNNTEQELALARSRAFQDFNRELGPRVSKRQTQALIGSYLDNPGTGRAALEEAFSKFPSQVQTKAGELLDRYANGLMPATAPSSQGDARSLWLQLKSEYKDALWPDTSANAWRDRDYAPRYEGSKSIEDFLEAKKDLLERRGEYIQAQASKGNVEPYVRHNQWLRRQGVLPEGAKTVKGAAEDWLTASGFGEDIGKYKGYPHEAFSHAFPDDYLGKVDKSLGKAISGADETRATMIDDLIDNEAFEESSGRGVDPAIYERATSRSPIVAKGVELTKGLNDITAESDALTENFIARAKEIQIKNKYGTDWDEGMSLPGEKEKNTYGEPLTIRERFKEAAKQRYPESKAADIAGLYERGLLPYARDVDKSDRLSLRRQVEAGLREVDAAPPGSAGNSSFSVNDLYGRVYGNTFFNVDPLGAAVGGGARLLKENLAGAATGLALSATAPEVVKSVDRGDYAGATRSVVKDTALGALTEAGARAALPLAQRVAPAAVRAVLPAFTAAGPVAAGVTLFSQGRDGSLTDVVTRKAANVIPGLRPDPKTDLGRKAGNELMYVFNSLRNFRLPYQRGGR